MEQNSKADRLHALDGLRGVAIIMVFLSHIPIFVNKTSLLNNIFFNSGVMGVSFLFILSGFLMAYLYPQPKNKQAFIQKRYTRIFPLFLTVSTTLFILQNIPARPWYVSVSIFLFLALFSHCIWVYGIKRFFAQKFTKILFFSFLIFQAVVGIYYFWVMQHPPIYYYQLMPHIARSLLDWFVNATLTLPIGKYVNMLDPVYWSLAAEVLFYILYPFFCAPLIAYMSQRKTITKILLLFCLLPFFGGIAVLSQHILYISLLRFQLYYYFVTGMALGYLYRKYPTKIQIVSNFFPGILSYLTVLLFIGLIYAENRIGLLIPINSNWIELLFAIPCTLLLAIALAKDTALAKLFRSKILVYIGTVSYSIYLSHMFILSTAIGISGQPSSLLTVFFYILFTLFFSILFSSILYFLLEKPYFQRKVVEKKTKSFEYEPVRFVPYIYGGVFLGVIMLTFIIYQNTLNFFTLKEPLNKSIISPATTNSYISLQKYPFVTLQFVANQNNFGVLNLHLIHQSLPKKKLVPQRIDIKIKEKDSQHWYSDSQYTISGVTDILPSFYGFPLIKNSYGKTYNILITQEVPSSSEYVLLDNNTNEIDGIFFVDKKKLIKNPEQLLEFFENKVITVMDNFEAREILILFLPFFLFIIYILITKQNNLKLSKKRT